MNILKITLACFLGMSAVSCALEDDKSGTKSESTPAVNVGMQMVKLKLVKDP